MTKETTPPMFDGAPTERNARGKCVWTEDALERIYRAYPLKKKPLAAKKAIAKALDRIAAKGNTDPVKALLSRTTRYADVRSTQDVKWTPHPATWFNAESYNEHHSLWLDRDNPGFGVGANGK